MDSQMIGTPENAQAFLNSIGNALDAPVQSELEVMLARLKQDRPKPNRLKSGKPPTCKTYCD